MKNGKRIQLGTCLNEARECHQVNEANSKHKGSSENNVYPCLFTRGKSPNKNMLGPVMPNIRYFRYFQDREKTFKSGLYSPSPVECGTLEKCKGKKCSCTSDNTCEHVIFDLTNIS